MNPLAASMVNGTELLQSEIEVQEEEKYFDDESSTEEIVTDEDDDEDPTFDIQEETCRSLSNLSIKKSKSRIPKVIIPKVIIDSDDQGEEVVDDDVEPIKGTPMDLDDLKAGQLEKLKVEECKIYLRKHGLRLTGNKDVLIQRIREHLQIMNGDGEHKYPVSSFVLNCKGDACTGDIVMFEQNVYEMFSIASRSATGPPCGSRVIAGRIVKESYGAAKQQHTFTIEVLWSKGVKPLPPLHPLLIKGRNLYRLQTMRQRWDDEGKRRQVLLEKHSRGACARSNRETRIQVKEMRQTLRGQRVTGMAQEQRRQPRSDTLKTNIQSQTQPQPPPFVAPVMLNQWSTQFTQTQPQPPPFVAPVMLNHCSTQFTQQKPTATPNAVPVVTEIRQQNVSRLQPNPIKPQNCNVIEQKTWGSENSNGAENRNSGFTAVENHQRNGFHHVAKRQHCHPSIDHRSHDVHGGNHGASNGSLHRQSSSLPRSPVHHLSRNGSLHRQPSSPPRSPVHHLSRNDHGFNFQRCSNENGKFPQRQPLTSLSSPLRSPLHRWSRPMERQICRYYPQGRCHYGDNCKFAHENGDRREHMPNNQRYYGY